MEKHCRQCERLLPTSEFYRKSEAADGLQGICMDCHKANMRARRAANRSEAIEYDRLRNAMPHRVEARKVYRNTPAGRLSKAGEKLRSPVKHAARQECRDAVRRGVLTRQPCEVCGEVKTHAHHDDYGKPLDVRWLCATHHAEWHKHNTPKSQDQEKAA